MNPRMAWMIGATLALAATGFASEIRRGTHPPCGRGSTSVSVLRVWTSSGCGACRQFWQDFQTDPSFRTSINSAFDVRIVDVDLHRAAAFNSGIPALPCFEWGTVRVAGYRGKAWLLGHLCLIPAGAPGSPPSRRPRPEPLRGSPAPSPADPAPATDATNADRSSSAGPADSRPTNRDDAPRQRLPSAAPVDVSPQRPNDARAREAETPSQGSSQTRPIAPWKWWLMQRGLPVALTGLQLLGVLGGSAATGGVVALALRAAWGVLRLRRVAGEQRAGRSHPCDVALPTKGGASASASAPFPRRLDEARQLLELRQSEGRVAVLDALRGMFLDDELQKLSDSGDERDASLARRLRNNIDTRIDEVAPLSTTID